MSVYSFERFAAIEQRHVYGSHPPLSVVVTHLSQPAGGFFFWHRPAFSTGDGFPSLRLSIPI